MTDENREYFCATKVFKNNYKVCNSALALLPARNFAVFEVNFSKHITPKELKN